MEVSVTTGALNPLLGKLTTLLGEEYKQLKVMRKEAAFLKHELSAMKALLDKMELMDKLDPSAKNWRDHIREMSYDMENCIDDFIHDIEGANAKKGFVRKMGQRLRRLGRRHQIANRMEELKVLAVEANAWCERYKINECINSSHDTVVVDLGMKAIYKEAAGLVGIDGPREDLVSLLMDSEKELKVVSIVGFGGLGKTALAKQVYDEVGEQFTLKAFFSVSQSPDVKSLLSGLQLKLVMGDSSHAYELENIVDRLREHLKHKRYLIIVDDLWDQSTWNTIRCAFPDNANGSRVVVTTRLHDVAATTCLSDRACIYNMKPLKEQDSRRLFFNRVFGPENACPPQFKEISAQILKKCGGLPLAIITIASLLASHEARPLSEWESIKNSLGAKSATKPTLEEMRAILNLSYMNLPVYLRPCFLYLGMYPEDREIERDDLVRQWIAEGFVPSLHGANLDDVAESYFNELVNRSMIQPERTACGEVLSCRVHDMMLDLILSKSTEDNFISVAYNYEDMATLHSCKYKVRRLSLQSSLGGATPENLATSMSQVRSYARFGGSQYTPPLSQLKYLRVLAFEFPDNWEMTVDLTAIGHLLLLRYLMVVARSAGVAFPTKIQGLVHLETLELYCEPTQSFPSDISCLENLFHLQLPIGRALPKGMKKMKSIRSLRCSDLSESSLEDIKGLSELTNLKGLDLSTDDNKCLTLEQEDAFVSSIGMLRDLKYLHLDCQRGCSDLDSQLESLPDPPTRLEVLRLAGWKFSRVPKWIGELRCLRILRLRVLHLSSDEFRALGELPSLVDSGVYVADVSRDKVVVSTGLFPVLENFEFQSNKDVNAYLSFEVGAMPRLQKLTLQFSCKKWRGATPVGMECLPCLQEISVCALLYTSAESSKNYEEVRAAVESAFKSAARAHPRHPSIRFTFGHSRVWKSFVSMPVQERVISDVLDYGSSTPTLFDGSVRASLGAMRPLVGKLDMLLQAPPKGCSSQSVKDKMQLLKEDVEEISSCLDELSEVEEPPLTAKCWMNQAHDLCYNIEDYIDSLLFVKPADPSLLSKNINSTRPRLKLSFHAKILKRLKRPEQIAVTVSKFSMLIQKAIERHQRYDLHSCSTLRQRFVSLGPMLPTPYEETADDIVIDGRMNDFINSLANDRDKQTKVISVLGSSCLGKTILSRVLYNRIGGQFDCRAFVRVSKQPDMKSIFRGMLSELQRQHPPQDCKEIDLIDNIKIYLQDKRYLVIVDDVWTASVWDIINHAFPRGSHGSRIITTTQIDDVALTCCCYQSKHVFQMKPLDDDHSRKLFFGTLFGSESSSPAKFKEDLNKIVEICGGLPLATISIASLLVSQPVMTTELLDYIRKSLSSRFLEKSTLVKTRQALNLSFNNLPRYLKSCLLYLSMYPEGYEFLKYDLVKQWVTEGLIDTTEGQDIENVAESYLDQLIGRRFIQPICISYNNEVVSCAVHDAIHDFIVHKSAEENFIVTIDHSRKNVSLSHIVRRLSLLFGDARYAKTPTSMSRSQIRSLRFSGLFECMPRIREFKLLRVLNLHLSGHTSNNDPPIDLTEISELFLLRYLKIASDVCIKLPNRMRGLQCLETLDVMAATRITAIPWDIIHLPHLFNLTLPVGRNLLDLIGSMGDSIISLWSTGKLNNLHNLHLTSSASTLASSDHLQRSMEALGTLLGGHGNLKTLALTHDDGSWHKDASRVIICWDGLAPPPLLRRFEFSPHSCITFSRIPQWLNELGNLCFLKITVRNLQINCVDILRGLPALATLSLYVDTAAFDKIIFGNTGFSVLKYFKFRCSAPWLKFEAGAMPNLGKLMLGFNAIPRMDQHRHANTVITIEHMPELKKISAKIGGATANTDAESALRTIVSNHQSNPTINVQLVDYIFYGEVRTKQKQQQPDEIEGLLLGETS